MTTAQKLILSLFVLANCLLVSFLALLLVGGPNGLRTSALPTLAAVITSEPLPTLAVPTIIPSLTAQPSATSAPSVATEAPITTPTPSQIFATATSIIIVPLPEGQARVAVNGNGLRLRESPGTAGRVLGGLDALTPLNLLGRTADNVWLEVKVLSSGAQGWVMSQWVEAFISTSDLPVTGFPLDLPTATPATATPPSASSTPRPATLTATGQPSATSPPPTATSIAATLPPPAVSYPYLSNLTTRARDIYLTGKALGNRANVFSKVGDSITVAPDFLNPIGEGRSVLHGYGYLASAIQNFSAVTARTANSFSNVSFAATNGWSAWTVLDLNYIDRTWCVNGETPLACEYRVVKPAIALIMVGTNDAVNSTPEAFRANLSTIVSYSIQRGVIPVISTIPDRFLNDIPGERVFTFNDVIREVAQTYQVPLWDYWASLQGLPGKGIGDTVHPSSPPNGNAADFSAESLQYGYTVRNLGALHILDILWREVMAKN